MTESEVVNEWIAEAEHRRDQQLLLRLLNKRFPGQIPAELIKLINGQDSPQMLSSWFDAAITVATLEEFKALLNK